MDPSHAGQLTFPNAGIENAEALVGSFGDWVDYWIRDQPNGIMLKPPIAYYLMGDVASRAAPGNVWKTSETWPPPSTPVSWYLRSGSVLSLAPPMQVETPQTYAYDPQHPVPTLGGGNLILQAGPYDQRYVMTHPDVLVFRTPVLSGPVEIVGDVKVDLFVSSDRLNTDFTAKLCDVYADGRAMLISDGILRARHRLRMDGEDLLVPGQIVPMTIDLWETAIVFNTGHRILVAISSSNAPRFDPNPNTGEPFMHHTTTLVAHNTVYHQPGYESRLVLPVTGAVPASVDNDGPDSGEAPSFPPSPPLSGSRQGMIVALGPSPFTDRTAWRLNLDVRGAIRAVTVTIVDCAGRQVRRLDTGLGNAVERGIAWDGRDDFGRRVPSGLYACVVWSEGRRESSPIVRIRQERRRREHPAPATPYPRILGPYRAPMATVSAVGDHVLHACTSARSSDAHLR